MVEDGGDGGEDDKRCEKLEEEECGLRVSV